MGLDVNALGSAEGSVVGSLVSKVGEPVEGGSVLLAVGTGVESPKLLVYCVGLNVIVVGLSEGEVVLTFVGTPVLLGARVSVEDGTGVTGINAVGDFVGAGVKSRRTAPGVGLSVGAINRSSGGGVNRIGCPQQGTFAW